MKYNVNNLDKFKNGNFEIESVLSEIASQQAKLLEDRIKELISPYVDIELIENKQSYEIRDILKEKGYIMLCNRDNSDYEEYCICDDKTGLKDFFIVKNNADLENGIAQLYISDIIRGID